MKDILERLIADFQESVLPELLSRRVLLKQMPGKVAVVAGMRRCGKTFFCYQQMRALEAAGSPRSSILYLNFEDERLLPFNTTDLDLLLDVYYAMFPESATQGCWFFFDEIQRIPGWEMFLRRILDERRSRVVVTGSSAKLLSREIATSLRGRSLTTEMFPFSFREFLTFSGIAEPKGRVASTRGRAQMAHAVTQYLEAGGFPDVLRAPVGLRGEILRGYLDVVILRDVVERHGVSNVTALRALLRQILHSPGAKFSVNRFAGQLRAMGIPVAKNALYEFVEHLADAYLVFPVELHTRSVRQRQVNARKIYAIDTGLLRAVSLGITVDRGALLENLVYLALRRQGFQPDYYVTGTGHEVDFVYLDHDGQRQLVQACWTVEAAATRQRELRALTEAMRELGLGEAWLVTWLDEGEENGVRIIPAWKWLLRSPADG
ncbi:MAG: hypothetical protein A3K19_19845 [Lentisphaerae bacterium RIFOXYB12_FULL_65_16]|nr:MAG: hypothetical protein A3K18_18940 [Lentisphaerae bacterium RIFOXYA12_64_32]OGV85107.1 MAG: hypothetical protein A3K19_19845 [Lentisphaerae bacterium RIFOXYB12_FULL_65_16]